jgi:hypothetical protein
LIISSTYNKLSVIFANMKIHSNYSLKLQNFCQKAVIGLISSTTLITQSFFTPPAQAGINNNYCHLTPAAIAQKNNLRNSYLQGNPEANQSYQNIIKEHRTLIQNCRNQNWLKTQAIWIRLYPCDARPGALDDLLDQLVNRGYNQVYVEVFYDSQVLLPPNSNPTPWQSVMDSSRGNNVDLLAQAIQKGQERGLKVYAWMFTMNFGYTYAQRRDRHGVLAVNGSGQNSLSYVPDGSQAFVDPYNQQARADYYRLVEEIAKRRPDGILYDYIRYPRGTGTQSVASRVQDLWIYSDASREALYQRAQNRQGRALIDRYIRNGFISAQDIVAVKNSYPDETIPMWQGRTPLSWEYEASAQQLQQKLQLDLWYLAVAHAAQGVVDFLAVASAPAQRLGIPTGAVFFPDGNQTVGQIGFDSRLQPWDKFPVNMEYHPMSYGVCGHSGCIVDLVRRVTNMANPRARIIPALAGGWGNAVNGRPSLENQMESIRRTLPQINSISHFAYSWQEPALDRERKFCRL